MSEQYIGPIRPMFNMKEGDSKTTKRTERMIVGTSSGGIVIDITKNGMELNAYYTGFSEDVKHSVLLEPTTISWDNLNKIKDRIFNTKSSKAKRDRIELEIDEEYLETLPVVTINGKKYYIDPEKRERRLVERPQEVWKF